MTDEHTAYIQLPQSVILTAVEEYLDKRLTRGNRLEVIDMSPVENDDTLYEFTVEHKEDK